MIKLSLLIPTLKKRDKLFTKLKFGLYAQMLPYAGQVELLDDDSEADSIGEKRNRLLQRANGEYLSFIDDDDTVCGNYVELLMGVVNSGCDCGSLKGEITINGGAPEIFEHSLKYKEWKTNPEGSDVRYERFPNHLNALKASIAKQFQFPEKNHGEDFDWSTKIHESGILKTEHIIDQVIYYYNYISNK